MREQEYNALHHEIADGDTPGVTISFIALDTQVLTQCLLSPTPQNRTALNREINRVVALRKQTHHPALKAYFLPAEAQGPYLVAQWYVYFLAGLAVDGVLAVPDAYAHLYRHLPHSRLPRFLNANNQLAGHTVCDHRSIFLKDPSVPTPGEAMAILATHTADVSYPSFAAEVQYHARFLTWYARIPVPAILATHTADVSYPSFAAEVQYHARFLTWYARIPVPFLGWSVYESAIRADMTIDDSALTSSAPFHNLHSKWVLRQQRCHQEQ